MMIMIVATENRTMLIIIREVMVALIKKGVSWLLSSFGVGILNNNRDREGDVNLQRAREVSLQQSLEAFFSLVRRGYSQKHDVIYRVTGYQYQI